MPIGKTCDFLAIQRQFGYRVLIYVGNISENKNQFELIRLMPNLRGKKILAVIAGSDDDRLKIKEYLLEQRLENSIIMTGFCDDLDSLWLYSDLNVFFSKCDGFGLSIIEGLVRGVPSLLFDDLDVFEDVKNQAVNGVNRNADTGNAIINSLNNYKNINKKETIMHAKYFSIDQMAKNYVKVYEKYIKG